MLLSLPWLRFSGSRVTWLAAAVLLILVAAPLSAAPFINLDFEQASVIPVGSNPRYIDAGAAFPGWTPRYGTFQTAIAYYDNDGIGESVIGLYDRPAQDLGIPLLQGHYMALLIGDVFAGTHSTLSQTGDAPASAQPIRLFSMQDNLPPPAILLDGVALTLTRLTNSGYGMPALFAADVSSSA